MAITTGMDGESTIRRRAFAFFWAGQSAAVTGAQLREFVVPVFAVVVLAATPSELGIIAAAQWLPFLLLALPLGAVLDRRDRRAALVLSQVGSVAAVGALLVATVLGAASVPALALAALVWGAFTVVFEVGYQSAVPDVVDRARLAAANGRLQSSAAVADIGAPGLGGLLIQTLGAAAALFATAASALVAAVAFRCVPRAPATAAPSRAGLWPDMVAGVRFAVRDPYLRANVGFSAIYNFFAQWITVLFTAFALRELGMEAWMVGVVFAVGAAGALVGAAFAHPLARRIRTGVLLIVCASVETVAFLALPFADGSSVLVASIVLAGAWALVGVGTALSNVLLITLRQLRTPTAMLGRVNASMRTVTYGVIPLGALAGGFVGEAFGLRAGILVGSILGLGTIVWVALSPLVRIRRLDDLG